SAAATGSGSSLAAQLAVASLGASADTLHDVLNDPTKLLQALAAANAKGTGSGSADANAASDAARQPAEIIPFPAELIQLEPMDDPGGARLSSPDSTAAIRMLTQFGATSRQPENAAHSGHFHHELAHLPRNSQQALHECLATIAAHRGERPDTPLLVQLAEQ